MVSIEICNQNKADQWLIEIYRIILRVTTTMLTLSHPEALPWQVKSYSVRQSKLTKGTVLAGLGEKGLRKRDGQVRPFPTQRLSLNE